VYLVSSSDGIPGENGCPAPFISKLQRSGIFVIRKIKTTQAPSRRNIPLLTELEFFFIMGFHKDVAPTALVCEVNPFGIRRRNQMRRKILR